MTRDEALAKLKDVPCPSCLALGSLAILDCGPGRGVCNWVGQCPQCGYRFDVEVAEAALERLKAQLHVREHVDPCPTCGARHVEVHFACDTQRHSCFFVASCRACGRTLRIPVRREDPPGAPVF